MVTDIQGVDYTLCDPEVASSELKDPDDNLFLFCTGNLSFQDIDRFLSKSRLQQSLQDAKAFNLIDASDHILKYSHVCTPLALAVQLLSMCLHWL